MKISINWLFILVVLSPTFHVIAEVNIDRLIKNQQDIDKSTRLENNQEKKDVYSSTDTNRQIQTDFPIEEECVPIDEIVIENDFVNDTALKKLKHNAAGRCLGILGIQQLAISIQDHIIKSGYITTRIAIPEQNLISKKLVLAVLPGKIEQITIQGDSLRDWVLPFKSEDILNLRDIEQGLELVQRVPLEDIKINIEPGSKDGYSNIVINILNPTRWNTRVWINNWGDKSTGKTLANAAGYLYNLADVNDIFYLSGTTQLEQHHKGSYQSMSAYYSIPLGYWEYEFFYSESLSKQQINIGDLNYQGKNTYLDIKASRMLYRDQDKKIKFSTDLLRRKANYKMNEQVLVYQKRDMTNIRFGLNYKQQFIGASLDSTLSYQRFVQWLGAEKTSDMDVGDVSPQSHIINLDFSYIKSLNVMPFGAYYQLQFGGQYSPKGLTIQDQFSIGNRWSVRGFENSAGMNGYSGFYAQNTLNVITGIKDIEWFVGLDYGQVWSKYSSENQDKLMGATTGLRGSLYGLGYELSVSMPLMHPDSLSVDRTSLSFNLSYQL